MAYQINLENFEGPFDLLLYLIQKKQIDIYDIPIAEITGEYLQTIRRWQVLDLEIASEFITMAARLMEIKSSMLLPNRMEGEEPDEDPQQQLIAELAAYQTFKTISAYFRERETISLGAVVKEAEYLPELEGEQKIEIDPTELSRLFKQAMELYRDDHEYKPFSGKIKRNAFRIENQIAVILKKLGSCDRTDFNFSELLKTGLREEVVVTFQALLECYKTGIISLGQVGVFGEIKISSGK